MSNDASRGSLFYILQKESLANEVKPGRILIWQGLLLA